MVIENPETQEEIYKYIFVVQGNEGKEKYYLICTSKTFKNRNFSLLFS